MKRAQIAAVAAVAAAIGGLTAWVNPRVASNKQNGFIVTSCGLKRVWFQKSDPNGFSSGWQTWEQAVEAVLTRETAKMMSDLSGNPFSGLALLAVQGMKPSILKIANQGFEDVCAGRSTQWLQDLSNKLNNNNFQQ